MHRMHDNNWLANVFVLKYQNIQTMFTKRINPVRSYASDRVFVIHSHAHKARARTHTHTHKHTQTETRKLCTHIKGGFLYVKEVSASNENKKFLINA